MHHIVHTEAADLPYIYGLFDRSVVYQESTGQISWKNYDKSALERDVAERHQYKILVEGRIAMVFSVCYSDPVIWRESERGDAVYLHRIVVNPEFKGQRLFGKLLDWVCCHAWQKGYRFIRMDTWAQNESIRTYYESFGFRFVESFTTPDSPELPLHNRKLALALLELDLNDADLILENFIAHATRIPSLTGGMQVYDLGHCVYVNSGLPSDTFNVVVIRNGSRMTPGEFESVVEHYRRRHFPFCVWVSREHETENLRTLFARCSVGWRDVRPEPGMLLELSTYAIAKDDLHRAIVEVRDERDVLDHARVIARLFSPEDENVIGYYRRAAAHILDQRNGVRLFMYLEEGQPVGVVELFATDGETVGIYGLVTAAAMRGRGIGTALMTYVLNVAKAAGYRRVVLQASEDGAGIYRRLGFREVTTYQEYA